MKKLAIAATALMLAGCASLPKEHAKAHAKHSQTKAVRVIQPAPVESTPNQIVKKRWYDRFKTHPKWFHG